MAEYDPGPLFESLRKEREEKRKKTMHPYRDANDLTDIRENIDSIRETLENLKLPKRSAIGQAIQYKIERFCLSDFLITIVVFAVVVSSLAGIGYCLYKWDTTSSDLVACEFDYMHRDPEDGLIITGVRHWHQDSTWGPFQNLEEAKQFAKENGCPE